MAVKRTLCRCIIIYSVSQTWQIMASHIEKVLDKTYTVIIIIIIIIIMC